MSEYSQPPATETGGADQSGAEPVSEQGAAVDANPGAFAPATDAGTEATDLNELGAGGVEDAPSGYLDDAAPDFVGVPAADAEQDAAADAVVSDVEQPESDDPAEEMRRALAGLPGDWYVVHSYAGYENKVKANLESRISSLNVEDYIFQIEVPTEEVMEVKGGKRQSVVRKKLPGYLFVRMDMTDEAWSAVRNTPGVTGVVGQSSRPTPLTVDEVV